MQILRFRGEITDWLLFGIKLNKRMSKDDTRHNKDQQWPKRLNIGDEVIHIDNRKSGTIRDIDRGTAKVEHRGSVGYYPLHRLRHTVG